MKSREQPPVAGMPWYARDDYPRVLEVMADANKLPHSFDAWLKRAEENEGGLKAAGYIVFRAEIEPDEFRVWCAVRRLNVDAEARNLFAAEYARRWIEGI